MSGLASLLNPRKGLSLRFLSLRTPIWAALRELVGANTTNCSFYCKIPVISLKARPSFAFFLRNELLRELFQNSY